MVLLAKIADILVVSDKSQFVTSISSIGDDQADQHCHNQQVNVVGIFHQLIDIYFNPGVFENIHEIPLEFLKFHQSRFNVSRLGLSLNSIQKLFTLLTSNILKSREVIPFNI